MNSVLLFCIHPINYIIRVRDEGSRLFVKNDDSKNKCRGHCALVDQWKAVEQAKQTFCGEQTITIHTFRYRVMKYNQFQSSPTGGIAGIDLNVTEAELVSHRIDLKLNHFEKNNA